MRGVCICFFMVLLGCTAAFAQGSLEVTVEGFDAVKGNVWVGLFTDADNFPKKADKGKVAEVTGKSVRVVFEGLKPGDYAVSIFHDANGNGEMDKNMFGIPKEGFGFGNDAMGKFGPPSFDKAKVVVAENEVVRVVVKVKYF